MSQVKPQKTVIQPFTKYPGLGLNELWKSRELIYFLAWREVKARYRQTIIGASWAILQPFLFMIVFSLILGKAANVIDNQSPYFIFAYTGLVPWMLFANGFVQASVSFSNNRSLVTKVYIPKLAIPLAHIFSALIDFACAFIVLLIMFLLYDIPLTIRTPACIFFIILAVVNAAGVGIWLSALNIKYRDIHLMIPFISQLWLLSTPVAVPIHILPNSWQIFWAINPMTVVIEGFRWSLLSTNQLTLPMMSVSIITTFILLYSGLTYFKMNEHLFADII